MCYRMYQLLWFIKSASALPCDKHPNGYIEKAVRMFKKMQIYTKDTQNHHVYLVNNVLLYKLPE